jgi:TolB-like protein/Tfp pilus assembly protein PilF
MPSGPNKLFQFWHELKRRNVTRVLTVYAGAAFVIIELINNITEPLHLPEWTPTLVIVLLAIGFPVVIIFSWIYDVHPEGGIVKTEPSYKAKTAVIPKSSNRWKVASYISFVVIVGLIVLNIIPRAERSGKLTGLETSIAVLPFENMSSDEEDEYLGGAFCDEIIMELQKIKAFDRVLSRTSTMQYGKDRPTIPEIAEKLNVNYIVAGSIQRSQQNVRIRVQVIRANNEDHIWGDEYDREWKDIFSIQDEIAFQVAHTLRMTLSQGEVDLIEEIPTTSLTAYDFYQRGRKEHTNFWLDQSKREALNNAIEYYKKALDLDPDYPRAYSSLAIAYVNFYLTDQDRSKQTSETEIGLFKDSILNLVNKALKLDNNIEEAYHARGIYYWIIQEYDKAVKEMKQAIAINPNYGLVYDDMAEIIFLRQGRWIDGIEAKLKAVELERGDLLPAILRGLGWFYEHAGFQEKSSELYNQFLQLTHDSILYYEYMAGPAYCDQNWEKEISYCKKIIELDSSRFWPYSQLPFLYGNIGNNDSAHYYAKKLIAFGENKVSYGGDYEKIVGQYYMQTGRRMDAIELLNKAWQYYNLKLENKEGSEVGNLTSLAQIAYIKGEYEEAVILLSQIDLSIAQPLWYVIYLEAQSTFPNLHSDERFQKILTNVKSEWQANHDMLGQWLKENDML